MKHLILVAHRSSWNESLTLFHPDSSLGLEVGLRSANSTTSAFTGLRSGSRANTRIHPSYVFAIHNQF
jgi:hypothetical protein